MPPPTFNPPAPRASTHAARPGSRERLETLRARAHRPGQASFYYFDAHFNREAVKVLPGEYYVDQHDLLITTTLGSCIAACLWDRERRVGGMNHFMLPDAQGAVDSGRYGSFAMELLINELIKLGATRAGMEAKVFGGGTMIGSGPSLNIGERNTRFVLDYLRTERIAVVSQDVLGPHPRKVCFLPASGKALVKRLPPSHADAFAADERAAAAPPPSAARAGSVDLF